jgi:O-antigen/teichoic acid export membrane protein
MINAGALFLPVIYIGSAIGVEAAGLLLLAQRIIGLPVTLLVSPISQVFMVEIATLEDAPSRAAHYRTTLRRFALLTGPVFLTLGIASPALFPALFGKAWGDAGLLAAILMPFYFAQLLSGATVSALDVLQAHFTRLAREAVFLVGTALSLIAGYATGATLSSAVIGYSSFGVLFYVISVILVHQRILKAE